MSTKRLALVALAGAATILLSGCTESGSTAAEVNGEIVTTSDVDFLARVQCAAINDAAKNPDQAGQVRRTSYRALRAQMVNTLIQSELNDQLAAEADADYDRSVYRQVMDQFELSVQAVPKDDQERFRDLVGAIFRSEFRVESLAQRTLAGQGVTEPTEQQVPETVVALQEEFRKAADITVNPVYGADEDGVAGSVDASLSRAVSTFAKQSTDAEPSTLWVDDLPASLRCG